jgi:hypothetical protein
VRVAAQIPHVIRVHPGATPTAYQKPVPLELEADLRCATALLAAASRPTTRTTICLTMTPL